MKLINLAVLRFSVCLACGIITAHLTATSVFLLFKVLFPIWIVLLFIFLVSRKSLHPSIFFGIITYVAFFTLGIVSYQTKLHRFQKQHFSHFLNNTSEEKVIELKIREILKPDNYNSKYIATTTAVNQISTEGKVLVYIQKDSLSTSLKVDDGLLIRSIVSKIPKPLNPEQFRYNEYMANLGIYHQLKLEPSQLIKRYGLSPTLKGIALNFRDNIIRKLQKTELSLEVRGILQALVLGEKRDIDKNLYKNYAAAGAIHILAVSGLHVGIIYLLLSTLLRPIKRFKQGKWITSIMIIILLWGFALVAGLSPSVVRAVTMFSFLAFAKILNRPTSTINTLSLSFFLLLIINPKWLFHVGFQLSYLAVFFIIWVQPQLYRLYKPRFFLDRLFWGIITVSIAAQLGVFPLGLYYFHQASGLFLLTNIVILPFLGTLLIYGLLIVLWQLFEAPPDLLLHGYEIIVSHLNRFIKWVASHEGFIAEGVAVSMLEVILIYMIIIQCIMVLQTKKTKLLLSLFASTLILLASTIHSKHVLVSERFIVFHKSRQSLIAYEQDQNLNVFTSDSTDTLFRQYPIKSFMVQRKTKDFSRKKERLIYTFKTEKILTIDSLGVYDVDFKVDVVLLTQSPRINLDRLIDSLQPRLIIADGSNYKSYVKRWKESCTIRKLPFHHTGTKGAFVWE